MSKVSTMNKIQCENCGKKGKTVPNICNKRFCVDCYKKQFESKPIDTRNIKNQFLKSMYEEKCYVDKKTGYYKFKDSGKHVHIWIMEKQLGRKLRKGEVVHHLNGDKLDNSSDNLMLFSDQGEHNSWHEDQKEVTGVW